MVQERPPELPDAEKMDGMIVADRRIAIQTASQHDADQREHERETKRIPTAFALRETLRAFAHLDDVDLAGSRTAASIASANPREQVQTVAAGVSPARESRCSRDRRPPPFIFAN